MPLVTVKTLVHTIRKTDVRYRLPGATDNTRGPMIYASRSPIGGVNLPPTVTVEAPLTGSLGSSGAVVLRVQDTEGFGSCRLLVKYPNGDYDVAWTSYDNVFSSKYSGTAEVIAHGWRLTVYKPDGWSATNQPTFVVDSVDVAGEPNT